MLSNPDAVGTLAHIVAFQPTATPRPAVHGTGDDCVLPLRQHDLGHPADEAGHLLRVPPHRRARRRARRPPAAAPRPPAPRGGATSGKRTSPWKRKTPSSASPRATRRSRKPRAGHRGAETTDWRSETSTTACHISGAGTRHQRLVGMHLPSE